MAKMFYTMDETKTALGKSEEEIKQYSREGRLREFRDGPRLMFKADQVEQLKNELAGGEVIGLAPTEEAPISLADEPAAARKEDTHIDLGLSGSMSGSPGQVAPPAGSDLSSMSGSAIGLAGSDTGLGLGSGSSGSRAGITVFDVEDSQRADPSAQTSINASVQDQISLESVGSGSGLLDLTRESDDTSLGAVFDELTPPGGKRSGSAGAVALDETQAGDTAVEAVSSMPVAEPIYIEQPDPVGVGIGAAALLGAIVVFITGLLLWSSIAGYRPEILTSLAWEQNVKMYLVGAIGVAGLFWGAGYMIAKMGNK